MRAVRRVVVRETSTPERFHYAVHGSGGVSAHLPEDRVGAYGILASLSSIGIALLDEDTELRRKSTTALAQALISKYRLATDKVIGFQL
jgi:hypothetical protein